MVCTFGAAKWVCSDSRIANALAYSEQNVNCTYVSWSYTAAYAEPAAGSASTAGSCFLKSGAAKVPVGANYRGLYAGAARGVVFSSVSQRGILFTSSSFMWPRQHADYFLSYAEWR